MYPVTRYASAFAKTTFQETGNLSDDSPKVVTFFSFFFPWKN